VKGVKNGMVQVGRDEMAVEKGSEVGGRKRDFVPLCCRAVIECQAEVRRPHSSAAPAAAGRPGAFVVSRGAEAPGGGPRATVVLCWVARMHATSRHGQPFELGPARVSPVAPGETLWTTQPHQTPPVAGAPFLTPPSRHPNRHVISRTSAADSRDSARSVV
jgi:hypothetical protein